MVEFVSVCVYLFFKRGGLSLQGGGAHCDVVCVFLLCVAIVLWPLIEQLSEAN